MSDRNWQMETQGKQGEVTEPRFDPADFGFEEQMESGLRVQGILTPEQAVAATLGRGECEMRSAEGSFRSANRPVYLCECGAFCTDYTDASAYHKPRYCPNCGRRAREGR